MDQLRPIIPGCSADMDTEMCLQIATTCVTNAAMLPAIVSLFRHGKSGGALIGLFTMITSSLYHYCDTTGTKVWGMSAGQWHRQDNVFAIMSFMNVCIHAARNSVQTDEILQWLAICIVSILQEKAPWNELFTVVPIAVAFACLFGKFLFLRRMPALDKSCIRLAVVSFFVAIGAFVNGLDDKRDYVRASHGMWHLAVGAFMYFLIEATERGKAAEKLKGQ
jgi:predicted membrane channel-forming protein YqfA (hemolysin III family)